MEHWRWNPWQRGKVHGKRAYSHYCRLERDVECDRNLVEIEKLETKGVLGE